MTTFRFTSPDGKTYEVDGPDGSTVEQAFATLQGKIRSDAGETSGGDDWWRNDPIVEPAPPAPSTERGPWENYRPLASAGDSRFKVDPGGELSAFEVAVLEEVLNTPLSELLTGDQRICTEDHWYYGPTVGNA